MRNFAILTPLRPGRHTIALGGHFEVPGQRVFDLTITFDDSTDASFE